MCGSPFDSTPDDGAPGAFVAHGEGAPRAALQDWGVGSCPELSGFYRGSGGYGFQAGWGSGRVRPWAV